MIHLQSSNFREGSFESHKVFHTGIQQMPATLQRSKALKNPVNSVKPEEINRNVCVKCKYACVLQQEQHLTSSSPWIEEGLSGVPILLRLTGL